MRLQRKEHQIYPKKLINKRDLLSYVLSNIQNTTLQNSFCDYDLLDSEKPLLIKRVNFSLPPKKLNYADYLVQCKLFYGDKQNLEVLLSGNLDFIKTNVKDAVLTSCQNYNANVPQHLNEDEFVSLKNVINNKDLIIQKSGVGNSGEGSSI